MCTKNSTGTFKNYDIRFAVTEPTHKKSSFYQRNHGTFGWRFDTANTNSRNCVKNAFKIAKLQSLTKKMPIRFILLTI